MQIRFSRKKLCIPYVAFLIFFVIAPLLVVFYYAFTNGQGEFTLSNLAGFFTDSNTIGTLQSGYCVDNNCCMPCDCVPCCVYTGKKQYEKKISNVIDFYNPYVD